MTAMSSREPIFHDADDEKPFSTPRQVLQHAFIIVVVIININKPFFLTVNHTTQQLTSSHLRHFTDSFLFLVIHVSLALLLSLISHCLTLVVAR